MGCACGGSSRSGPRQQQQAAASSGSSYEFEVTYNDGATATFATEGEAQSALAWKGGGYRMVAKR